MSAAQAFAVFNVPRLVREGIADALQRMAERERERERVGAARRWIFSVLLCLLGWHTNHGIIIWKYGDGLKCNRSIESIHRKEMERKESNHNIDSEPTQ